MHVLSYGNFSHSWNTEAYIARALERKGHRVSRLSSRNRGAGALAARVKSLRPDIVLVAKIPLAGMQDLQRVRGDYGMSICWVFDLLCRQYSPRQFRWAQGMATLADLFYVTDGSTAPRLPDARVLHQGVPDDWREPAIRDDWITDVGFLGSVYPGRRRWLRVLQTAYQCRTFSKIRGGDLSDLMQSIKVMAGPLHPSRPYYWSNRLYVVTGYGGCFVTPELPGMAEEGWLAGTHYCSYDSDDSLRAQIDLLLRDEDYRRSVAATGCRFARANHTYDHRVRVLMSDAAAWLQQAGWTSEQRSSDETIQ